MNEKLEENGLLQSLATFGISAIASTVLALAISFVTNSFKLRRLKRDLEHGILSSTNYNMPYLVKKFYPDLVKDVREVAEYHKEDLEGLSAQSAVKYLGKILKFEEPGLWKELTSLRIPNAGREISKSVIGNREGKSDPEKLSAIKARWDESTEQRIFDSVLRECNIF